jgi:hypothetical protein
MHWGLENEELAFQERLAFAKHEPLEDKLLEHDDEFIFKFNEILQFNGGELNVEWN